jgi:hypothetical protein
MEDLNNLTLRWLQSIGEVGEDEWNSLTDGQTSPFLEWGWLNQLEKSGSVSPEAGWLPFHLTLWWDNKMAAAAPLYIKGDSTGEFVWDWGWAEAAAQFGTEYYPKMVGTIPATPSGRYRFLIAPELNPRNITDFILRIIEEFCTAHDIKGIHFLFTDPDWSDNLPTERYLEWLHQRYLWENRDYTDFSEYLGDFNKNQRKNIRKERRSMEDQDLRIQLLPGPEVPPDFFPLMYRYYEKTNDQFGIWAAKYLTRRFFTGFSEAFLPRLLLAAAFEPGTPEPAALSFLVEKNGTMWGRYWGTREFYRDLHFNLCYYSPIEWAIAHGVREFDPGAGSPHKLRRGFQAVTSSSFHYFLDPLMQRLFAGNIERINRHEISRINEMNSEIPWKNGT